LKTKLTKHFENTSTLEIENSFIEDIEEENRIVHDLTDKYCTEPQTNLTDLIYESHVVNYKTYELSIQSKGLINPKVIIFEGLYNLFNEVNFGQDITELLNKYDIVSTYIEQYTNFFISL